MIKNLFGKNEPAEGLLKGMNPGRFLTRLRAVAKMPDLVVWNSSLTVTLQRAIYPVHKGLTYIKGKKSLPSGEAWQGSLCEACLC